MELVTCAQLAWLRALVPLLISAQLALAACPRIVSREEWGAHPPLSTTVQQVPVPFVVVHHGGLPDYCTNTSGCAEQARAYQKLHMDVRGWDDIGYSFLVGEDGNVYEGRGWRRVGAHAPGYNSESIGVCVIGDFSDRVPNRAALDAVQRLVACGVADGLIVGNYTVLGHRQARDTLCPGNALFREVTTWPHWDPAVSPRKYRSSASSGSSAKVIWTGTLTLLAASCLLRW